MDVFLKRMSFLEMLQSTLDLNSFHVILGFSNIKNQYISTECKTKSLQSWAVEEVAKHQLNRRSNLHQLQEGELTIEIYCISVIANHFSQYLHIRFRLDWRLKTFPIYI